jgi:hypothetical protein
MFHQNQHPCKCKKTGTIIKKNKFDKPGIIVSLNINLKTSANGCKIPHKLTTLDPHFL